METEVCNKWRGKSVEGFEQEHCMNWLTFLGDHTDCQEENRLMGPRKAMIGAVGNLGDGGTAHMQFNGGLS